MIGVIASIFASQIHSSTGELYIVAVVGIVAVAIDPFALCIRTGRSKSNEMEGSYMVKEYYERFQTVSFFCYRPK